MLAGRVVRSRRVVRIRLVGFAEAFETHNGKGEDWRTLIHIPGQDPYWEDER